MQWSEKDPSRGMEPDGALLLIVVLASIGAITDSLITGNGWFGASAGVLVGILIWWRSWRGWKGG